MNFIRLPKKIIIPAATTTCSVVYAETTKVWNDLKERF
jgi:hypothetical protein